MENNETKSLGIVSIITSIIGFFFAAVIFGTIGLITGIIGWKQGTLAKIGAILGAIDVIAVLIFFSSI